MEVYCAELTRELSGRVDLTTHALPGRADGRPPANFRLAWFFIREAFYLLRHRNRYDVIHYGDLVMFPLAWWCQALGRSCRQVISVHGTDIAYGVRRGKKPALYRRYLAWIAGNQAAVDVIVANSRATAGLCRKAGLKDVEVVRLGVRLSGPHAVPAATQNYLLFVGRLVRR